MEHSAYLDSDMVKFTADFNSKLSALKAAVPDGLSKKNIDELREDFPPSLHVLLLALPVYEEIGAYDRTEQLAEQILKSDPENAVVRLKLVKMLIERKKTVVLNGDVAAITRRHLAYLQEQPNLTAQQYEELARILMKIGEFSAALQPAIQAIEVAPDDRKIFGQFCRIEIQVGLRNITEARRELESLQPHHLPVSHMIVAAILYEKARYYDRALELAHRAATALRPGIDHPNDYLQLAALFKRRNKPDDAKTVLQSVGAPPKGTAFPFRTFYYVCYELGLNKQALTYVEQALQISPYDPVMMEHAAVLRILVKVQ